MKKLYIIFLLCFLTYYILSNITENFTQDEMNNYNKTLKDNCAQNTKLYNELQKLNNENCNKQGQTERETINNKSVCYDNIHKEIVTKFDMESNCIISDIVSNNTNKQNEIFANQVLSNNQISTNTSPTINEGPGFINQWTTQSYNMTKTDNYSNLI